ncbi:MAG: hypothetical protein KBS82_04985 [Oscillospiraceae bacterium]|nr:hypothetical protein [Candidatus Limimonas egerieequi]
MKTESDVRPQSYLIEVIDDMANVIITDNIVEVDRDDTTFYEYDMYIATVPYSPLLDSDVKNNYDTWLANLKNIEQVNLQSEYIRRIELLIRGRYSINDELAIQRQRDSKPDEWDEYFEFVERCKADARTQIYGQ